MNSGELAIAYLERLDRHVALADSKAATILVTIAFVAGAVAAPSAARMFGQPPFGGDPVQLDAAGWYLLAAGASLGGSVYALISAMMVLTPRVRPVSTRVVRNPYFFGSASSMDFGDFEARLSEVAEDGIAEQCFQTARIVDAKMSAVQHASYGLYFSLVFGVLTAGLLLSP